MSGDQQRPSQPAEPEMLFWAMMFAAAVGIAGLLGFGGAASAASAAARVLFFVFLVGFLVVLVAATLPQG